MIMQTMARATAATPTASASTHVVVKDVDATSATTVWLWVSLRNRTSQVTLAQDSHGAVAARFSGHHRFIPTAPAP